MNVEAVAIAHLRENGFAAFADVPDGKLVARPDEFVTVERTGGPLDSLRLDKPTIAVQAWSTSKYAASELMRRVDACMRRIVEKDEVCRIKRNSMYNYPDENQARYQAVYDLVTYE